MEQLPESNNKMSLFVARLLLEEGRSDAAQKILEAIEPENEKQEQELAYFLGWAYTLHRRWVDATRTLSPLSHLADDGNELEGYIDRERLAKCLLHLGIAAYNYNRFEEASRHFSKCLKVLNDKRVKLPPIVRVRAHYSFASTLMMRGKYEAAIEQYHMALRDFLYEDDNDELANIYYGLSDTFRRAGNLKDAREAGEQALKFYISVENHMMEGQTRNLLGHIALESGDYRGASDHFTMALSLAQAPAEPARIMSNNAALADVRLAEGKLDEARRYCLRACEMMDRVSSPYLKGLTYLSTAKVTYAMAQEAHSDKQERLLRETIEWLEQAKDCLSGIDADNDIAAMYQLWAQTLEETGQYQEALNYWRSGYEALSKAKGPGWY